MIRFFILRIVVPLIVVLVVRSAIVAILKVFADVFKPAQPPQPAKREAAESGGELKKDPVCGTYVSPAASVTKRVNGEIIHFCSVKCRDQYSA